MKTKRKLISLLLAICLVAGLMPLSAVTAAAAGTNKSIMAGAAQLAGAQKDNVYFGTYMQSSDGNGGYNTDPIKWRVLSNGSGKLFMLADQNLDVFQYHTEWQGITWGKSTMRSWLNGYDASANTVGSMSGHDYSVNDEDSFLRTAFSGKEQGAVSETEIVNAGNPEYNVPGGANTKDKVFLLSIDEAMNEAYGFTNSYDRTNTRVATNTAYVAGGGKIGSGYMGGVGRADVWWLRSLGADDVYAAFVGGDGSLFGAGNDVNYGSYCARPAFKLNLNSVLFTSAAVGGKISAAEGGSKISEITGYTGNEWKATLLDDARSFTAKTTAKNGNTLTVEYSGANDGPNEYISVLIANSAGAYTHYGRIAQPSSASGTVKIDLSGITMTGKKLYVFNEQYNGGTKDDTKLTDYASALKEVATTGDTSLSAPVVTKGNDAATGKPKLTWKAVSGAAKYEIYRSDSAGGTYVKLTTTTGTTFMNTSAVAGKTYYYKVKAIPTSASAAPSVTAAISVTCKYSTPKVTGSNNAATGKNVLKWEAVPGAAKYEVYRYDSASSAYVKMITTAATTITHSSAVAGKTYAYKVKAVGSVAAATSAASSTVKVTCKYPAPKLTGSQNSTTGKNVLTWEQVADAAKYEVYRYDSASGTYVKMITTSATTLTHSSAVAGKTYAYKVRAVGTVAAAASGYSNVVKLTCKCEAPKVTGSTNPTTGKPKLTWDKVDGAAKYEVYRYDSAKKIYVKIATTTYTSITNTNAQSGVTYYYKVKAIGATTASDSALSTSVKITCK